MYFSAALIYWFKLEIHFTENKFYIFTFKIDGMKTMTCKQLGGACNKEFKANTFEEMAELSKQHSMKMFQKGDKAHLKAKDEMMQLMKSPNAMQDWFENKRMEFDALPEDK